MEMPYSIHQEAEARSHAGRSPETTVALLFPSFSSPPLLTHGAAQVSMCMPAVLILRPCRPSGPYPYPSAQEVARTGVRIARCMSELFLLTGRLAAAANALLFARSLSGRLWHDSELVARQFDGVGPKLVASIIRAKCASAPALAGQSKLLTTAWLPCAVPQCCSASCAFSSRSWLLFSIPDGRHPSRDFGLLLRPVRRVRSGSRTWTASSGRTPPAWRRSSAAPTRSGARCTRGCGATRGCGWRSRS